MNASTLQLIHQRIIDSGKTQRTFSEKIYNASLGEVVVSEVSDVFFKICEIADKKKTPVLILENVKNLKSHDKKRTWQIIENELKNLGYAVFHQIIDAANWVPQHRERIFIVCFRKKLFGENPEFSFPAIPTSSPSLSSILEKRPDKKYTLTDHLWSYLQGYKKKHEAKGNGFGYGLVEDFDGITRTLSARYYKDGSEILLSQGKRKNPRRLTIVEAARLMGYGDIVNSRDDIPVSDTQTYKQFGNSVVPAVVTAVGRRVARRSRRVGKLQFVAASLWADKIGTSGCRSKTTFLRGSGSFPRRSAACMPLATPNFQYTSKKNGAFPSLS